jgi:hypothetical protein
MAANIGEKANYIIKDVETGNTTLAINDIEVLPFVKGTSTTHDVILTTAAQDGILYKIEISNVTDKAGNLINGSVTKYVAGGTPSTDDDVFLGKAGVVDATGPSIATAKLVDVDSSYTVNKGDQIQVYFNERIQNATFTMNDFALSGGAKLGTVADPASFQLGADQRTLTITLGDVSAAGETPVADTTTIQVSAATTIKDLDGNKGDSTAAAVTIDNPLKTTDFLISYIKLVDGAPKGELTANGADEVIIGFNRDLTLPTTNKKLSQIFSDGYKNIGAADGDVVFSAGAKANEIKFTVNNVDNIATNGVFKSTGITAATTITASAGAGNKVVDKWGNEVAFSKTAPIITMEDKTAPSILSAVVTKVGTTPDILEATDTIKFTFSKPVSLQQANAFKATLYAKNGELTATFDGTIAYDGTNYNVLVLTLPETTPNWGSYTISGTTISTMTGSKVFSDAAGNTATVTGVQLTK